MSQAPPKGLNQLEQMIWAYPWMRPSLMELAKNRRAEQARRQREAARQEAERRRWERWQQSRAPKPPSSSGAVRRPIAERGTALGREQAPLYIRFGDIPASGRSSTLRRAGLRTPELAGLMEHTTPGDYEAGVSCFRARKREDGGYEIIFGNFGQAGVFETLKQIGRPCYLIEGEEIGLGGSGEPLLKDAHIVETLDPEEISLTGGGAKLGMAKLFVGKPPETSLFVKAVLKRAPALKDSPLHGEMHWRRVAAMGALLCERVPEADPLVVYTFALFHDAAKLVAGLDVGHGKRGAQLAREMLTDLESPPPLFDLNHKPLRLSEARLNTLYEACSEHMARKVSNDPTIGTCFDADRLNIWRVGVKPDPALLSTEAARDPAMIERGRMLQEESPSWVSLAAWFTMLCAEGGW